MALTANDLKINSYDYRWLGDTNVSGSTYGYSLKTNKGQYVFVPEDILLKGVVSGKKQFYFDEFLNKDFLTKFYESSIPVDFADYTDFKDANKLQGRLKEFGQTTKGFLVPESFVSENLRKIESYDIDVKAGNVSVGALRGIGEKDGQLVYIPTAGGASGASAYITTGTDGNIKTSWVEKKGGLFGDIARAIGGVPLLPELAGIISGNPTVYASLKGLQAGVSGEDPLKAGLKAGLTVGAAGLLGDALGGATGGETGAFDIAGNPDILGGTSIGVFAPPIVEATQVTPNAPEVFPVEQGVTPEITPIAPAPAAPTPTYDLLGNATFPTEGITTQLPPIPEAVDIGTQPIDYSLTPQVTPGVTEGQGLLTPTTPALPAMGGGTGLLTPTDAGVVGGTGLTPVGATPVLGDPASIINNPEVLGQPVINYVAPSNALSNVMDTLRAANAVKGMLTPQQAQIPGMRFNQVPRGAVDYSPLLSLLSQRVQRPNVQSLLG